MATKETISCDAPGCGKDITEGDGRQWTLNLYSQVTKMKDGSTPRVDQGDMLPLQHFCDETCLVNWATVAKADKATRQAQYEAEQAAAQQPPAPPAPVPGE